MVDSWRRRLWYGMFLFLLGLAAHLEGEMNGIFLLALGAIRGEVGLAILAAAILVRWGLRKDAAS